MQEVASTFIEHKLKYIVFIPHFYTTRPSPFVEKLSSASLVKKTLSFVPDDG